MPLMLYGHSWGGFAVSAVSNYPIKNDVKAIVSVSGFEKNSNVIKDLGKRIVGRSISLFMPYVNFYENILFGENSKNTGIGGLSKSKANVMIIHSENDDIVDYQDNYMAYYNKFKENNRFTFLSLKENMHNGLLQPNANRRIEEILLEKENLDKDSEKYKQLTYEEYKLTLNLDEKVLNKIIDFYNSNL